MAYAGMDRDRYPGDDLMLRLWDETNLVWTGFYLPYPNYGGGGGSAATSWQGKRPFLRATGWGVVPIFFGRQQEHIVQAMDAQRHPRFDDKGNKVMVDEDYALSDRRASLTKAHGAQQGKDAAGLAFADGFPFRTVIFLDIEGGNAVTGEMADYYGAWSQAVFDNKYYPGVYCSPLKAPALMERDARPLVWAAKYRHRKHTFPIDKAFPTTDPSSSGYAQSDMWQLAGDCFVSELTTDTRGHKRIRQIRDARGATFNVDFNTSIVKDPSRFLDF